MIIQCPECQTRYNVADDRLNAGVKMRCHKCRAVFVPGTPQTEPTPAAATPLSAPEPTPTPPPTPPEVEEDIFGSAFEQAAVPADEDDFSFAPADEEPEAVPATADNDFDFGSLSDEPAADLEDGYNDGFVTELDDEAMPEDDLLDEVFAAATDELDAGAAPEAPVDADIDTEGEEDWSVEVPAPTKQNNPMGVVKLILLLLLLALLGGVGYLMWSDGVDAPMRLFQQIISRAEDSTTVAQADLEQVKAFYVTRADAGDLYVIEGVVVDRNGRHVRDLRVKGTLYGVDGPLQQNTVACGHRLSNDDLRALPLQELSARLSHTAADLRSARAPFTLVFSDLPQGLTEFTVELLPA